MKPSSYVLLACLIVSGPQVVKADLLVGDPDNHRVLRFSDFGTLIGVFGQADDGVELGTPAGIALDRTHNVYVKSMTRGDILRFDRDGRYLGFYEDGGTGTQAGLAFDAQGNLWFRRLGFSSNPFISSHMVKLDTAGSPAFDFNTLLGGYGPFGFDSDGLLYVPNNDPHEPPIGQGHAFDGVYRFKPDGTPLGAFGQATNALSGCVSPQSVAFDSTGRLYVLSQQRILRYERNGLFLGVFVNADVGGYMMIDPYDNVYAHGGGSGVMKFDRNGNFLGRIVTPGLGGVPANFRSEAIAYLPSVPEPAFTIGAIALGYIAFCDRRRA